MFITLFTTVAARPYPVPHESNPQHTQYFPRSISVLSSQLRHDSPSCSFFTSFKCPEK